MKPFSKIIAVYGSSAITQDSPGAEEACRMGKLLAEAKFTVCNGGYCGAMEATSRGAREAQGEVIGVTTDSLASFRTPNPHLTRVIHTTDLLERLAALMRTSDAYIVLDGGVGTLAELFIAWNLVYIGWKKPIIVVGDALKRAVHLLSECSDIEKKHIALLNFVPTVEDAADFVKDYFSDCA